MILESVIWYACCLHAGLQVPGLPGLRGFEFPLREADLARTRAAADGGWRVLTTLLPAAFENARVS